MTRSLALSGDLGAIEAAVAVAVAAIGLGLLGLELLRARDARARARAALLASGVVATLALLGAVLRPVSVSSQGTLVGPRVVVLLDASRSNDLPGDAGTRRETTGRVLDVLDGRASDVHEVRLTFGEGKPEPVPAAGPGAKEALSAPPLPRSDLAAALEAVAQSADERPAALVVVSDGRLDRPAENGAAEATRAALGSLEVPVHTVALAQRAPADASIRGVRAAGAAVAHQPFSLQIEVGCDGLPCDEIPVAARELRDEGEPAPLASGAARVTGGTGVVELSITLDRAGPRIVEVSMKSPSGDAIPDNDRRFVTVDVTRDRVRVLHVAGRPTYDVRALRMWLKADASVDVVAFFILRTPSDDVGAPSDELALIPFPVDELFSEHLPSFDAVVLQDFNAAPYGLTKHLGSLARYVEKGGGLIMVGGPDAFVPGHYAKTPLADVLPVELDLPQGDTSGGVDVRSFVPRTTPLGRGSPVLAPLRALLGDELPEMPGANVVGPARPGAKVLLEHPILTARGGAPMPVLALGEQGSGRSIALAIDGSHRLLFSNFAASAAGRAHGAFWDALLGWLMRDPRFEPVAVELPRGCFAGEETAVRVLPHPGASGPATLSVARLGSREPSRSIPIELGDEGTVASIGRLEPGGYSATVELGAAGAKGPSMRRDFACERGGDEWADSRPDVARLRAIAEATGGKAVAADDAATLPLPPATVVATERYVAPLAPPWIWTLTAALALGAHWIARRRGGLV